MTSTSQADPEQLSLEGFKPVDEDESYTLMAAKLRKNYCNCGDYGPCFTCTTANAIDQLVGERGTWAAMIDGYNEQLQAYAEHEEAWRKSFADLSSRYLMLEAQYQQLAVGHTVTHES